MKEMKKLNVTMTKTNKPGNTRGVNEIYLSEEQKEKLQTLLPFHTTNDESYFLKVKNLLGFILEQILFADSTHKQKVEEFKNGENHILVVRNFPIEKNLPPTPYTGYCRLDDLPLSTALSFAMMGVLEVNPITYKGENDGYIVRHVSPSVAAISDVSSHGSKIEFGMHVDNPDLPLITEPVNDLSGCPEYLSLHSLRTNVSVPTKVMLLDDVIKYLSKGSLEELQKAQFVIKRPDSFVGMNVKTDLLPILSYSQELGFISRYDKQNVEGHTDLAQAALKEFQSIIDSSDKINKFVLQPGDYVIFRNQKTLHSREGFTPNFNGIDRWMIRLFGIKDLNRGIPAQNEKPYVLKA